MTVAPSSNGRTADFDSANVGSSPAGAATLTPRQAQLMGFVRTYMRDHSDVPPSMEEMAAALGIKSKSAIFNMLALLEARGHIHRRRYGCRVMTLARDPADELRAAVARHVELHGAWTTADALERFARDLVSSMKEPAHDVS